MKDSLVAFKIVHKNLLGVRVRAGIEIVKQRLPKQTIDGMREELKYLLSSFPVSLVVSAMREFNLRHPLYNDDGPSTLGK